MQTLRNLYHSIPLDWWIPKHPVPMLSNHWVQGYSNICTWVRRASTLKMLATVCYRHADGSGHISCHSPRQADSNETVPDSGGHLPPEISPFLPLLTSIAMRTARNIPHSIPLNRPTPTHPVPMLSDCWLKGYPNIYPWVPRASTFKLWATECYRHADTSKSIPFGSPRRADSNESLPDSGGHPRAVISPFFHPASLYSHADASKPIPFDSPRPADCNAPCLNAVRPLVEGLSKHLDLSSTGKYFQNVRYWVLQACGRFKTYTIEFHSASGLRGDPSRHGGTSPPWDSCSFHPADLYSHADAPKPIPFDSPRWADSNETLPDPGRHLPIEVSAFFTLLPSIAMWMLQELYHSIPLTERNPMHSIRILSDRWFKCYPHFCTLVLGASPSPC